MVEKLVSQLYVKWQNAFECGHGDIGIYNIVDVQLWLKNHHL